MKVLQINRIEKVNASFKSVLLIQWQKCEIFCNKTSINSNFFTEKCKYVKTIQKTNPELNF